MWSSREREHAKQLNDDRIARPTEPRGSRAVVGQAAGANISVRTRQLAEEAAQADHATPERKAFLERDALLQYHIDAHNERQQKERDEEARRQKAKDDKIAAERAEQERARLIGEQAVARANRAEILGIMRDDLDLIEEVTKEVGRHKGEPLYYPAALAAVKQRRKQ